MVLISLGWCYFDPIFDRSILDESEGCENLIKELKHDVKGIKDEFNEIKSGRGSTSARGDFETRLIQIERRLAEQEQGTPGVNVWTLLDFPKTSKVTNLKQSCSMFLKWPEHQWKNAISMQYTEMRLQSFTIRRNFVS